MAIADSAVETRPLSPALGAELKGYDLSAPLDAGIAQALRDSLHQHSVILLRGQQLTPARQVEISRLFGDLRTSFYNQYAAPGQPELTVVSNIVEDGRAIGIVDAGSLWHTDASYLKTPDMYTQLYAIEIPHDDQGVPLGDTLFISTAAAYEALPSDMRQKLLKLRAIHSFQHHLAKKDAKGQLKRAPLTDEQKAKTPDVSHPVVRTHPVTGRKSLFVTEGHTARIEGLPADESQALLDFLWEHVKQPRFMYRHKWAEGDLLVWDNCSTQHLATMDYAPHQRRRLYRAGVAGGVPF